MTHADLSVNLDETMMRIARGAGRILMRWYEKLAIEDVSKKGPRDMLTIADKESEAFVVEELRAAFPGHAIWAEESGGDTDAGKALESGDPVWFIDPLDGTTNFVHSHPFFSVALGLTVGKEPVAGCVYSPRLDEMFVAVRGRGAFLNGRPMRPSTTETIREALLATGFAYQLETAPDDNTENFKRLVRQARGVRRCGSASLDLVFVGCGRYDGFWEIGLAPWDVAAGAAIVREAGGMVTDFRNGERWLFGQNIVVTNGRLHDRLRSRLDDLEG